MTAITAPAVRDSSLRLAIRVDGVVVGLLGAAMVVAAASAPTLTGLPTAVEYVVGVASVAYLPLAFWLASRTHVRRTGFVVAEINAFTTVGLGALVLTGVANLTHSGTTLALVIAGYTAAIGAWQYLAARRLR